MIISIELSLSTYKVPVRASPTTPSLKLIIRARITKTPHPDLPISLCTRLTPLGFPLGNPSFTCFWRVDGPSAIKKCIAFNSYCQPNRGGNTDLGPVATVPSLNSGDVLTIEREVERKLVDEARVEVGERYRVRITDRGLSTVWWGYGEIAENVDKNWVEDKKETKVKEEEKFGVELVLENDGMAEFEIIQEVTRDTI